VSTSKILIVDDDEDLAMGLGVRLRANGYQVDVASDAVAATAMARNDGVDLVILDLGLPAGGGLAVLERMRAHLPTALTPVIVLTAGDATLAERTLAAGADAFFQKPADNLELTAAISGMLARVG
jgi:DNA-binding response OmpR family regulator